MEVERGEESEGRERVGARFTAMQLDRASTSFLFERVYVPQRRALFRRGTPDRLPHRQVETESYATRREEERRGEREREEKVRRPGWTAMGEQRMGRNASGCIRVNSRMQKLY